MMNADRFSGSTAIVTGGGSGIGRSTALRLAREGATVVAVDVSQERLDALVAESPDLALVPVAGDLSDPAMADRVVAACNGRIDALANVAGIMDRFQPAAEVDDEIWQRVFDVNVNAMMRLTRAVLPVMIDAGRGAVVNVSSEASLRASAAGVAYTASKNAVNGFTESVAFFYGRKGIRCNAVIPGAVMTNIEASFASPFAEEVLGPVMAATIQSVLEPDQLAAAICFLLSDDASGINGALLPVDGGWSVI